MMRVLAQRVRILVAVQGVVGGVEIEPDLRGWGAIGVEEAVDQQAVHARGVGDDLFVTRAGVGLGRGELQAVEGAGARQRLAPVAGQQAIGAARVGLAHQHRQQRVEAQAVVVVEILIAQRQSNHPLRDELGEAVLDRLGVTVIGKLLRQACEDLRARLDLAQQQSTTVGADPTPIEFPHHHPLA
jgi:hypothetical protein